MVAAGLHRASDRSQLAHKCAPAHASAPECLSARRRRQPHSRSAPACSPALASMLACLFAALGLHLACMSAVHTHYDAPRQNPACSCRSLATGRVARSFPPPPCPRAALPPVVITVGPACQTVEKLVALLEAGVTCARIDLTVRASPHGPLGEHSPSPHQRPRRCQIGAKSAACRQQAASRRHIGLCGPS